MTPELIKRVLDVLQKTGWKDSNYFDLDFLEIDLDEDDQDAISIIRCHLQDWLESRHHIVTTVWREGQRGLTTTVGNVQVVEDPMSMLELLLDAVEQTLEQENKK
jgi:hypothetical protein